MAAKKAPKLELVRTPATPRSEADFYPTPKPLPERIVQRLWKELRSIGFTPEVLIEPSAGEGAFVDAMKLCLPFPITAVEIDGRHEQKLKDEGADLVYIEPFEDWIKRTILPRKVLVIGNPPFSLAEEHILLMLDYLYPGSYIAFLLKMNFKSGRDRAVNFWPRAKPKWEIPIAGRPSFKTTERATTDSNEYSVIVWEVGYRGPSITLWPHIEWKD